MKTAKQINDNQIPGRCLLYGVKDDVWLDKPDSEGWWWSLSVDYIYILNGIPYARDGIDGVKITKLDTTKWLKITEPTLPKEVKE